MFNYYQPMEPEEGFGKLSKINSAGLVNSALHNLWLDFWRHFRDGKYLGANSDLDCIWTVLGGEKGIEGSDTEKYYFVIERTLSESGNLQNSIQVEGFDKIDDEQIEKMMRHKSILLRKALFLRRLQNSQGKGTAYSDGEDEDFE